MSQFVLYNAKIRYVVPNEWKPKPRHFVTVKLIGFYIRVLTYTYILLIY